jgi:hypothetical protein
MSNFLAKPSPSYRNFDLQGALLKGVNTSIVPSKRTSTTTYRQFRPRPQQRYQQPLPQMGSNRLMKYWR